MGPESELDARARGRLGTVLRGKYRLDRVLGVGGMAVVYAATHRNRKQLAVKMLHAELSIREGMCARFHQPKRAAPAPSPPSSPAPAATPACRVVTYFDADGNERFKQECQ